MGSLPGPVEDLGHPEQRLSSEQQDTRLIENTHTNGFALSEHGYGKNGTGGSGSACARWPEEIIESLLYTVDPDGFASLVLLNRKWRRTSQIASLYAHQLLQCPSFTLRNPSSPGELAGCGLTTLRKLFAQEVVRNLFAVYLKAKQTTIKLISTSTTSSTALPQGEPFRFSFSLLGNWVLATSSSRVYLVNVRAPIPHVQREFQLFRKPAAVDVLDDGSLLAVLATDHLVNIYDIGSGDPHLVRCVSLDFPAKAIALSPDGTVIATANEVGIEVISLAQGAKETDRRAVRCDCMDKVAFSPDGTQLLGTSCKIEKSRTAFVSPPTYTYNSGEADVEIEEPSNQIWTTQILFPTVFRDCSHAIFLPNDDHAAWLFAYDKTADTFGVLDVDEMEYMRTVFPIPPSRMRPSARTISAMPTVSESGNLVAAVQPHNRILLYAIPDNMRPSSDFASTNGESHLNGGSERPHALRRRASKRSVTARVAAIAENVTAVKWVSPFRQGHELTTAQRLVAVAPGGVSDFDAEGFGPVDGGRVVILDFAHSPGGVKNVTMTIEVGDTVPEILRDAIEDMDSEVTLARRGTLAQRQAAQRRNSRLGRSVTSASNTSRRRESYPGLNSPSLSPDLLGFDTSPFPRPRRSFTDEELNGRRRSSAASPEISAEEAQAALDVPYSPNQPRSTATLQRAATAAALVPRRRLHALPSTPLPYRRADGRREVPHESDADDWRPPPPPYSPDADTPVPDHLNLTLLPQGGAIVQRVSEMSSSPIVQLPPIWESGAQGEGEAGNRRMIDAHGPVTSQSPDATQDLGAVRGNMDQFLMVQPVSSSLEEGADTSPQTTAAVPMATTSPIMNVPLEAVDGPRRHFHLSSPSIMPSHGVQEDPVDASYEPSQALPPTDSISTPSHEEPPEHEQPQTRVSPDADALHSLLVPSRPSASTSSSSSPRRPSPDRLAPATPPPSTHRPATTPTTLQRVKTTPSSPSPAGPNRPTTHPLAPAPPDSELIAKFHRRFSNPAAPGHRSTPDLSLLPSSSSSYPGGGGGSPSGAADSIAPPAAVGARRHAASSSSTDDLARLSSYGSYGSPGRHRGSSNSAAAATMTSATSAARVGAPAFAQAKIVRATTTTTAGKGSEMNEVRKAEGGIGDLGKALSRRRKSVVLSRVFGTGAGKGTGTEQVVGGGVGDGVGVRTAAALQGGVAAERERISGARPMTGASDSGEGLSGVHMHTDARARSGNDAARENESAAKERQQGGAKEQQPREKKRSRKCVIM